MCESMAGMFFRSGEEPKAEGIQTVETEPVTRQPKAATFWTNFRRRRVIVVANLYQR